MIISYSDCCSSNCTLDSKRTEIYTNYRDLNKRVKINVQATNETYGIRVQTDDKHKSNLYIRRSSELHKSIQILPGN